MYMCIRVCFEVGGKLSCFPPLARSLRARGMVSRADRRGGGKGGAAAAPRRRVARSRGGARKSRSGVDGLSKSSAPSLRAQPLMRSCQQTADRCRYWSHNLINSQIYGSFVVLLCFFPLIARLVSFHPRFALLFCFGLHDSLLQNNRLSFLCHCVIRNSLNT